VPTWESPYQGEQEMMKIPEQFTHVFEKPAPLSEDIGQQLAEWAAGSAVAVPSEADLAAGVAAAKAAKNEEEIINISDGFRGKPWTAAQRKSLQAALVARRKEIEAATAAA
jgi:hypothetical protein